jgi:hypothetical protein
LVIHKYDIKMHGTKVKIKKMLRTMFAEVVGLLDPEESLLPLSQYIGSCGNGHTTSLTSCLWYLCQLSGPAGYGSCCGF